MYEKQENLLYYITVMNEAYEMPAMPTDKGTEEGILRGMYKLIASPMKDRKKRAHLFGSGTILNEAIKAQKVLEEEYGVSTDVWSVTSYKELYWDAIDTERTNTLNRKQQHRDPFIVQLLKDEDGVFVAASDYVRALPNSISKWIPGPYTCLGTDGYGRSENRESLRDFFEVDSRYITLAALHTLYHQDKVSAEVLQSAQKKMNIDPKKPNPLFD
jgi:pyruvate dehydrogenase E1 component